MTSASLVGRQRELGELAVALEAAEAGRGGLVLLAGEPGIGKTTLAHAFAAAAASRGARLAWGRAWKAGGAPAFWPWVEVLRELFGAADVAGEAARAVGASLAVAGEIVPELAPPEQPRPPALAPAQARFRLFDAVGALLRWTARDRAVVIVLDDLHAADPATLSLLQFAVRAVARSRVLPIGTARDVEARLSPEIAADLARVARESRYLVLSRLGPDEVAAWLDAAGDARADERGLADLLYQRTEGNPLFLVETYRLLRGDPRRATAALPEGVRDVIAARLRALPGCCRRLLEGAAALGRSVDLGLLAAVSGATMICVPHSLSRRGPALGAQAGEARLRGIAEDGGFTRFRRATETPFNLILEARP